MSLYGHSVLLFQIGTMEHFCNVSVICAIFTTGIKLVANVHGPLVMYRRRSFAKCQFSKYRKIKHCYAVDILVPALDAPSTPLGMENGKIRDSQIKTNRFYWPSTEPRTHYSGISSRLNAQASGYLGAGWRPHPALAYPEQWLEVIQWQMR